MPTVGRVMRTAAATLAIGFACAACSPSGSTIEIRLRAPLTETGGFDGLLLWLGDRQFTSEDFADDSGVTELFARVPNEGTLLIRIELSHGGVVVAEGALDLTLRDEFEWGMDLYRQTTDPADFCLGCMGSVSFPISESAQNDPGEAVWIAWGGKPRGSEIVFQV